MVLECLGAFVDRHVCQKLQEPSVKLSVFGVGLGDQPALVARYVGETSGGGRSRSCKADNEIRLVRIVQLFELIEQNLVLHWNQYVSLQRSRTFFVVGAAVLTGKRRVTWSETIVWTEVSIWQEKLCVYGLSHQSVSCIEQLSSCEDKSAVIACQNRKMV